jgi:predicted PurR-regulated permease PerM
VFSGYFRGQATDAAIVGVLAGIALSIVGVPYAPVVGLLTGLGNLIPYVGGPVGYASIVVVCFADQLWGPMIAGIIAMSVVMFVDGNIINPRVLSNSVEVHPILVIIALIAGAAVGGIAGMLVAVPVAAWLKIQLDRWMDANEAKVASQAAGTAEPNNGEQGQPDEQAQLS